MIIEPVHFGDRQDSDMVLLSNTQKDSDFHKKVKTFGFDIEEREAKDSHGNILEDYVGIWCKWGDVKTLWVRLYAD